MKKVIIIVLSALLLANIALFAINYKRNDTNDYCIEFSNNGFDSERKKYAEENRDYDILELSYMNIHSYPTDVVFVGDSLTFRCPWNELYPELNVKNRGIGSDTINGLLARIDSITATKPKKVFLMVGINDLSDYSNCSIEELVENYLKIVNKFKESCPNCRVYVQSCLPVVDNNEFNKKIEEFNNELKDNAQPLNYTFVDLYTDFVKLGETLPEIYRGDGVHLNGAGYEKWKSLIDEYVYE